MRGRSITKMRHFTTAVAVGIAFVWLVFSPLFATGKAKAKIGYWENVDKEMAGVVLGKDKKADLDAKFGGESCIIPSLKGKTLSHFYITKGGEFLRFDIMGNVVVSMTISMDPIVSGICYAPIGKAVPLSTKLGIQLGDPMDKIINVYGKSMTKIVSGDIVRLKYRTGGTNRVHIENNLVFRNKKLVLWSSAIQRG